MQKKSFFISINPAWLFAGALVVAVFLAYQPAWHAGFIWDDDNHLLNNPVLKPGGLGTVWVPGGYLNYWPLAYTAYRLQFALWGLNPAGFHLVNIALHAGVALLVWRVLTELRMRGALLAAGIFALHPVNVESVAWVSQLKNNLALLFALCSVLFFLKREQHGGGRWYALALCAFLFSGLAKGIALTLPVVLLAGVWWRRGRVQRQDLYRVMPFILVGAVLVGVEIWTQQRVVATDEVIRSDNFLSRTAIAGCAVWFYLWKLIWPVNLCFVYPRWQTGATDLLAYAPGVLLVAVMVLAWWRRQGWGRAAVMMLVCYVALLLPALGFVNIYFMMYSLVSDHYQYAAMIAPCALFAGAAAALASRHHWSMPLNCALATLVLGTLATLTWRQCRMYHDNETLYRTILAQNPGAWFVHNNLGNVMESQGRLDEAVVCFREAVRIRPDSPMQLTNLGQALATQGNLNEAIRCYEAALQLNPRHAVAHCNLGNVLAKQGHLDNAARCYELALRINPQYALAHNNLGKVLWDQGKFDQAISQYQEALRLSPSAVGHNDLANILEDQGKFDQAISQYREALRLSPNDALVCNNLGYLLAKQGHVEEAIPLFQNALRFDPGHVPAQKNLATALRQRKVNGAPPPQK